MGNLNHHHLFPNLRYSLEIDGGKILTERYRRKKKKHVKDGYKETPPSGDSGATAQTNSQQL